MNEAKRILAVAVGPQQNNEIGPNGAPADVRPHVRALGGYGVPQYTCGVLMADYVDQIISHSAEPRSLKFTDAEIDDFKWVISREAAQALNIGLPLVI